jgi:hypothetical protein
MYYERRWRRTGLDRDLDIESGDEVLVELDDAVDLTEGHLPRQLNQR